MSKKEQLKKFFNTEYEWLSKYYENNNDYINGYDYILLDTLDYDKARNLVEDYSINWLNDNLPDIAESVYLELENNKAA